MALQPPSRAEQGTKALWLPPGWQVAERVYESGNLQGRTYYRFFNDRHSSITSLRHVVKLHAQDMGLDSEEAVRRYDESRELERQEKMRKRQLEGHLPNADVAASGPRRDELVELFRSVHGKLDGATICALDGWRAESRVLSKCGQLMVKYHSPENRVYPLVVQVEAHFGFMMEKGMPIPDIAAARATLGFKNGRAVHTARDVGRHRLSATRMKHRRPGPRALRRLQPRSPSPLATPQAPPQALAIENNVDVGDPGGAWSSLLWPTIPLPAPPSPRLENPAKRPRTVAYADDYKEAPTMHVTKLRGPQTARIMEMYGVLNFQDRLRDAEVIHRLLVEKGFPVDTELLYVNGCSDPETPGAGLLQDLHGTYFRHVLPFQYRPYYQKVLLSEDEPETIACTGHYISWSPAITSWKIGGLEVAKAGLAVCREEAPSPASLTMPWLIYWPLRDLDLKPSDVPASSTDSASADARAAPFGDLAEVLATDAADGM